MTKEDKRVFIPVSNDYMFQKIFCNSEKPQYFKDFYESIFKTKVESIKILESKVMERKNRYNKLIVLDALAKINGEYVHIEMQNRILKGIEQRIEFYPSKILSQLVKSGQDYDKIKKIKSIWIINGILNKEDRIYIDKIKKMYEKRGTEVRDQIVEIYIIELGKIGDRLTKEELEDPSKIWCYYIKAKEVSDLSQIRTLNPIIDEAIEKENMEDAEDEAIWNRVREEEAERLYQTQINWAKREGEARGEEKGKLKGISEGRKAEKREVIIELYKMNFNIDKISKIVKLSKEEITKIIKGKKRLTN